MKKLLRKSYIIKEKLEIVEYVRKTSKHVAANK